MREATLIFLFLSLTSATAAQSLPAAPPSGINPTTLAIVVNETDPLSRRVADYYRERRAIPDENILRLRFAAGRAALTRAEFAAIKNEIDRRTPRHIQAYLLTWTQPYRVECMSITTAFAAGFDTRFCAAGCGETRFSPLFNADSRRPYSDFGWRPTMALAGSSFDSIKALIDRGVAADATFPAGTGYLVSTADKARNVRAAVYPSAARRVGNHIRVQIVDAEFLEDKTDVLFYFIGAAEVAGLKSNRFLPGAIADHLTSSGGQLTGSGQMSSLRWLEAGATASYGSVVEPCNHTAKFPSPGIVMAHYLAGEPLIEAYWKSVAWPGQGIFIGEPLATPYRNTISQ